ncbi:MAG: hypothetical protein U0935_11510 [Pirellulales bacterium]
MSHAADEQRRRNTQSRLAWEPFAAHRQQVTRLVIEQIETLGRAGRARVRILGAGNCNDLDLARLVPLCDHLELVDLDGEALAQGVERQLPAGAECLQLRGNIDLTGILDRLEAGEPGSADAAPEASGALAESLLDAARNAAPFPADTPPVDVVASLCLLSQLVESVLRTAARPGEPIPLPLLQAVRQRHLEIMVEGLRAGGRGLLVSDIVSSVSFAPLPQTPLAALPALLRQLIAERNFFTGLNPAVLEQLLRTAPTIGGRLDQVLALPPWLWDLGPRVYAVVAWSFARRTAEAALPAGSGAFGPLP